MIKLLRVDHRLLHGQVVFSWVSALDPDCSLVANDDVVKDELRNTTLKLGKPNGDVYKRQSGFWAGMWTGCWYLSPCTTHFTM